MDRKRFKLIPTVYLILIKKGEILLSRRYNTGFQDGNYSLPAGHLEKGETLRKAVIRETKEEIGIQIEPEDLELVHVLHRKEPSEERINFFLTTKKWRGKIENLELRKCDDLSWFSLKRLPENTIPYVKQAISCFLKKSFYSEWGWRN